MATRRFGQFADILERASARIHSVRLPDARTGLVLTALGWAILFLPLVLVIALKPKLHGDPAMLLLVGIGTLLLVGMVGAGALRRWGLFLFAVGLPPYLLLAALHHATAFPWPLPVLACALALFAWSARGRFR